MGQTAVQDCAARWQLRLAEGTTGGDAMLGDHPITPVLLAKDLAANARAIMQLKD